VTASVVALKKFTHSPGGQYEFDFSDGLQTGPWAPLTGIIDANGNTVAANSDGSLNVQLTTAGATAQQYVQITATEDGTTTIIAGVAGEQIVVTSLFIDPASAVTVNWQSHTTSTVLIGPTALAANDGYVLPYHPLGWFAAPAGEAVDINLSGAVNVGGCLTYVTIPVAP
jgi:hypothetical protein